jgi:DNA-binding NtrC family response regulator
MRPLRVIVVDDEPNTCSFLRSALVAEGHECTSFLRSAPAEQHLAAQPADLALVDIYLGSESGLELVHRLRAACPGIYAVIMTAHVSVETAARAAAEGAVDYVSKPLTLEQVRQICTRAAQYREQQVSPAAAPEPEERQSSIIGRSPKMLEVYKAIARVAPSSAHVLISGPSGSGKELVARAIHEHSRRAARPFIPVNCAALTETLLETELFGHEKGAFTGAAGIHKGLVETSDGGTLFLDEVTETALSFQVKLLRVIQEQQVRRVGSTRHIPVDVRVIAASNKDVPALIKAGLFREDLYYRLGVVQIALPAINERRQDIPLLVAHFLQQFNQKNERAVTIEPAAVARLQQMDWPGNVRELENMLHRLAIFTSTSQVTLADVETEVHRAAASEPKAMAAAVAVPDRLIEMERDHIVRVLKEARGNKAEAARRLGIERKTLYKKALRLGIDLHVRE